MPAETFFEVASEKTLAKNVSVEVADRQDIYRNIGTSAVAEV